MPMAATTETATFALNLSGDLGAKATSAAAALEQLRARIKADEGALRQMEGAWKRLNAAGTVNIATARLLRDQISAQKAKIASAQAAFVDLGGSFTQATKGARAQAAGLGALAKAFERQGGPLGAMIGKLRGLAGEEGAAAAKAFILKAALVAVGVAIAYAGAQLLAFGVAVADERRSELLQLEGMTKLRYGLFGLGSGYTLAADKASFLQSTIDSVSGSVAIGRDKVAEYAQSFYRMGLRGGNLQQALEGVSIAASAAGETGAQQFTAMAMSAGMLGKSIKSVADDARARFGGIVKAQMLSLGVQAMKLREGFRFMFSGLKIERLLESISSVTSLFTAQTETGRRLKQIFETVLQPLIDGLTPLGNIAKRVFQGMVIGALGFLIAALTVRNFFRKWLPDLGTQFDYTWLAVGAGVLIFSLLAAGAIYLAGALFVAMLALIAIGAAIYGVYAAGYQLFKLWQLIDWTGLGRAICDGVVNGIASAWASVKNSVSNLADTAWKTFKAKLHIASPSKDFAFGGKMIGAGASAGVESSRPAFRASIGRIADDAKIASTRIGGAAKIDLGEAVGGEEHARAERAAVGGSGKSVVQVTIGDVVVNTKATDAEGTAAATHDKLATLLEGVAEQLGARRVRKTG